MNTSVLWWTRGWLHIWWIASTFPWNGLNVDYLTLSHRNIKKPAMFSIMRTLCCQKDSTVMTPLDSVSRNPLILFMNHRSGQCRVTVNWRWGLETNTPVYRSAPHLISTLLSDKMYSAFLLFRLTSIMPWIYYYNFLEWQDCWKNFFHGSNLCYLPPRSKPMDGVLCLKIKISSKTFIQEYRNAYRWPTYCVNVAKARLMNKTIRSSSVSVCLCACVCVCVYVILWTHGLVYGVSTNNHTLQARVWIFFCETSQL